MVILTYYSPFQIAMCLQWTQTLLIKNVTVVHSLSSVQAKFVDCACNLEIAHTCYSISRLPAQSRDSENAQRHLKIVQMLRLRATYTYPYSLCHFANYVLCLLVVCIGGLWKAVGREVVGVQCMLMCMESVLRCGWVQCSCY